MEFQFRSREGWKRKSFFMQRSGIKKIAADSLTAAQRSGAGGTPKTKNPAITDRTFDFYF